LAPQLLLPRWWLPSTPAMDDQGPMDEDLLIPKDLCSGKGDNSVWSEAISNTRRLLEESKKQIEYLRKQSTSPPTDKQNEVPSEQSMAGLDAPLTPSAHSTSLTGSVGTVNRRTPRGSPQQSAGSPRKGVARKNSPKSKVQPAGARTTAQKGQQNSAATPREAPSEASISSSTGSKSQPNFISRGPRSRSAEAAPQPEEARVERTPRLSKTARRTETATWQRQHCPRLQGGAEASAVSAPLVPAPALQDEQDSDAQRDEEQTVKEKLRTDDQAINWSSLYMQERSCSAVLTGLDACKAGVNVAGEACSRGNTLDGGCGSASNASSCSVGGNNVGTGVKAGMSLQQSQVQYLTSMDSGNSISTYANAQSQQFPLLISQTPPEKNDGSCKEMSELLDALNLGSSGGKISSVGGPQDVIERFQKMINDRRQHEQRLQQAEDRLVTLERQNMDLVAENFNLRSKFKSQDPVQQMSTKMLQAGIPEAHMTQITLKPAWTRVSDSGDGSTSSSPGTSKPGVGWSMRTLRSRSATPGPFTGHPVGMAQVEMPRAVSGISASNPARTPPAASIVTNAGPASRARSESPGARHGWASVVSGVHGQPRPPKMPMSLPISPKHPSTCRVVPLRQVTPTREREPHTSTNGAPPLSARSRQAIPVQTAPSSHGSSVVAAAFGGSVVVTAAPAAAAPPTLSGGAACASIAARAAPRACTGRATVAAGGTWTCRPATWKTWAQPVSTSVVDDPHIQTASA